MLLAIIRSNVGDLIVKNRPIVDIGEWPLYGDESIMSHLRCSVSLDISSL
jgi:hypothetical protein